MAELMEKVLNSADAREKMEDQVFEVEKFGSPWL